ncbi:MAG: membrane protein insertase YidC [Geminicoccaceae bacterium]
MSDQRNLILAIVLSVGIILVFQVFYEMPRQRALQEAQQQEAAELAAAGGDGTITPQPTQGAATSGNVVVPGMEGAQGQQRETVVAERASLKIDNGRLHGSLPLAGDRIDDITLADYHTELSPSSPEIELLDPAGTANTYFAESGWVADDAATPVPTADTVWTTDAEAISANKAVSMQWDNGAGLLFEKTVTLDENYMFELTRKVTNNGSEPVALYPYDLVSRWGTPKISGFYILHEGPIGVMDGTLTEIDYSDLQEDGDVEMTTTGGWLGITDKYWLTALVPDQAEPLTATFRHSLKDGQSRYQVDYLWQKRTIAPGETASVTHHFFAGAKEVYKLDAYSEKFGIPLFDRAVDFGWFYFLTKPIFHVLEFFYGLIGNYGIAILCLTLVVKLLFFPLANKSYKAMSQMKKLQPKMQELRERYGEDKQKMQQELMALYKKEKVNPMAGCLPIIVQIPVFFSLYKVLFVNIEMRHAPFFGWIKDLSAPDPTSVFNLFGLLPFDPPQMLMIGALPLMMGFTMWLQQRLNPQPADPVQAKVMMFLPVMFTFLFATFSAGLVLYWTWNNILSIAQQWIIMRKMGVGVDGQNTATPSS